MTQLDILQAAFDRGESLTMLEAALKYGIGALSQRVGDLKRDGYPIATETVKTSTGKHVARYRRGAIAYG